MQGTILRHLVHHLLALMLAITGHCLWLISRTSTSMKRFKNLGMMLSTRDSVSLFLLSGTMLILWLR
uniref:Uncharacterized protein n=1 Tax=Arundo donax TaxID=35708 RepID=A0A0A8ZW24_ARUDO